MSRGYHARTPLGRIVNEVEETVIAVLLGLMTLLTFTNVVLRYGFNSSIIWSLEVTLILFSWLVLFGIAYGFKVTSHLGVDAVTNLFGPGGRKVFALVSAAICIVYAVLLAKGAWDYWAPFADLPKTTGIWLPTGFDWDARTTPYFETDQVPIPFDWFKTWLEETFNSYMDGDRRVVDEFGYMPRVVPYFIIPVSAALILFRVLQASWRVWTGAAESLIVSHEAEDAVEGVAHMNRES